MKDIHLLLAGHWPLIRQGVRSLLTGFDGLRVVGEAATVEEMVRLAEVLRPEAVLLDMGMPGGLQGTWTIRQRMPEVEIVVMADSLHPATVRLAIAAGATACVLKDVPVSNLVAALQSLCAGRAPTQPQTLLALLDGLAHPAPRHQPWTAGDGLTSRELEILRELANGITDQEIAARLGLAAGTVKTHIHHILHKLGARNRTQAVAWVLREGLIH